MLDRRTLQQLGKQMEIDEFTILREYLQIRFLDRFYRKIETEEVYFKGGTAIRLLFGSTRFSDDLDFTNKIQMGKLKQILRESVTALRNEFSQLSLKDLDVPHGYSAKLILPTEISRQNLTIKLDFSDVSINKDTQLSPIETRLPAVSLTLVKHLAREEILAEKLRALWKRDVGRDLFDLWFLLSKGVQLDERLVQDKYDLYGDTFDIAAIREKIAGWDEKKLDQDLRKFLPRTERKIIPELKRLVMEQVSRQAS